MHARDVMSTPVYTVRPDTTIEQAAALLADRGFAAAPVVADYGRLVGIVSEGDLIRRRVTVDPVVYLRPDAQAAGERPRLVSEVMTEAVHTITPDTDVAEIANRMLTEHIRSMPVVERGEVVGMISRRDILQTVVRDDDILGFEVQLRLDQYAGDTRRWTATVTNGVVQVAGDFEDEVERQVVTLLARSVPGVADARAMRVA